MFKTNIKRVNLFFLTISFLFSFNFTSAAAVFYDNSAAGQSSITLKSPGSPQMAGNTGALQYSYPFEVPGGRSGMSPEISLSYNSQSENNQNHAGFGFSLSMPYVQRVNNYGIPKLYTSNDFTSSLHGELVKTTDQNIFIPKNNSTSFPEYKKIGDTFELSDNSGTKYIYGGTDTALVKNASSTSEIYTWYLTDVTDIFVKNSTTTATVMQLECMNNLKRITERKSAYIFHDPSKQSF